MSEHNSFGDIADRHIGPDPDDIADWDFIDFDPALDLTALLDDQPEPEPDPSRHATEAEYYTGVWTDADPALDLADLLDSPCLLPLADDLGSYAHLVQRIPSVELTSDAAMELRARVGRDAA